MRDFQLPEGFRLEEIQGSLRHVCHLHLDFFVTEEILAFLFKLMPNVTSIALSSNFDGGFGFLRLLPKLLGTSRCITELDFCGICLDEEQQRHLISICSASLQKLRIRDWTLPPGTAEAFGVCTKLRHLSIKTLDSFGDQQFEKLLLNNPGLKTIIISNQWSDSDRGLEILEELKRLGKLARSPKAEPKNEFSSEESSSAIIANDHVAEWSSDSSDS